jgi:hypothetical protein
MEIWIKEVYGFNFLCACIPFMYFPRLASHHITAHPHPHRTRTSRFPSALALVSPPTQFPPLSLTRMIDPLSVHQACSSPPTFVIIDSRSLYCITIWFAAAPLVIKSARIDAANCSFRSDVTFALCMPRATRLCSASMYHVCRTGRHRRTLFVGLVTDDGRESTSHEAPARHGGSWNAFEAYSKRSLRGSRSDQESGSADPNVGGAPGSSSEHCRSGSSIRLRSCQCETRVSSRIFNKDNMRKRDY